MRTHERGSMVDHEDRAPDVHVPERFEVFYRDEYRAVVALVYGLAGSRAAAEDIAQEAFLRAHRQWDSIRNGSPGGWVRRTAMNLGVSRYRRLRSEAAARLRMDHEEPVTAQMSPGGDAFWNEVRNLPKRQAQVIALRYIEEYSTAEISETLDVAEGTVKALLHQGRERLRRQLVAKGWVDDEV